MAPRWWQHGAGRSKGLANDELTDNVHLVIDGVDNRARTPARAWLIVTDRAEGGSRVRSNPCPPSSRRRRGVRHWTGRLLCQLLPRREDEALIPLRGTTMGMTDGKTILSLPEEYLYLGTAKGLEVPVVIWVYPAAKRNPRGSPTST